MTDDIRKLYRDHIKPIDELEAFPFDELDLVIEMEDLEEMLTGNLEDDELDRFTEYVEACAKVRSICMEESFVKGFRVGALAGKRFGHPDNQPKEV